MFCQLGQDIHQLREKNRDLLNQLESNSALLENRLKKLRHTARTPKRSDKSWRDLPPSPLKRKYDSWKARNNTNHVSGALGSQTLAPQSDGSNKSNSDISLNNGTSKRFPKSPAKRSKQNVVIVSGIRKKRQCSKCKSNPKKTVTKPRSVQKQKKPCPECYCPDIYVESGDSDDETNNAKGDEIEKCPGCSKDHSELDKPCLHELVAPKYGNTSDKTVNTKPSDKSPSHPIRKLNSRGRKVKAHQSSSCLHGALEEARSVLTYSPESVFLRRLKKRSQVLHGDFSGHDKSKFNSRKTCNRNGASNASLQDRKENINSGKGQSSVQQVCCQKRINEVEATSSKERASQATQTPHHIGSKCYCPEKDESPCCCQKSVSTQSCHTGGKRATCQPKQSIPGYDVIAGVVENRSNGCCCGPQDSCQTSWFDEMSKFRHKHWFDCHAHQTASSTNVSDLRGNLLNEDNSPQHKCLHRYVLNDRLFPCPVYTDHHKTSRCVKCHLPEVTDVPNPKQDVIITLPIRKKESKGYPLQIRDVAPSISGKSTASSKKQSSLLTSGSCGPIRFKQPVPSNSLALRYQKGVI